MDLPPMEETVAVIQRLQQVQMEVLVVALIRASTIQPVVAVMVVLMAEMDMQEQIITKL